MKKFLFMLSIFLIVNPVMAKNIKVEALSDFSTAAPPKTWRVKILEGFVANNGVVIHPNTIVEGKIVGTTSPKRLKRNATFKFVPKVYYDPQIGYSQEVKRDFEGKYSSMSDLDAKTVVKKGAVTAGNLFIGSFVAPAVGFVEGVVKNEEGNRAKSAVVSAYESTPLSYASKGKDIELKSGQVFIMSFKLKDEVETDKPNYSYEITN